MVSSRGGSARVRPCRVAATSSLPGWSRGCQVARARHPREGAGAGRGLARGLDRSLPTRAVPRFDRRFSVVREDCRRLPVVRLTPAAATPTRTLFYVHGGGYMAPIDPFQVRYATRLAAAIGARVVMPDYPLAPEHTWRDSFEPMTLALAAAASAEERRWCSPATRPAVATPWPSASRCATGADRSRHTWCCIAPWVDLTTSTPETATVTRDRPVAVHRQGPGVRRVVGGLARGPRPPGGLARVRDLAGLPPALMLYGTRDTVAPGCRLLTRRPLEDGWDLTVIEEPGLIHVYACCRSCPRPAGPGGGRWSSSDEDLRRSRSPRSTRSRRTASGSCGRTSSSSSRSVPTPTSTARTSSPRPGTW